jgi:hypothetical protein
MPVGVEVVCLHTLRRAGLGKSISDVAGVCGAHRSVLPPSNALKILRSRISYHRYGRAYAYIRRKRHYGRRQKYQWSPSTARNISGPGYLGFQVHPGPALDRYVRELHRPDL